MRTADAIPSHGLSVALATTAEMKAPDKQHALDGDVHDAGPLAQHAGEGAEYDRDGTLDGGLQDAGQVHRLAGRHPGQEGRDERERDQAHDDRPPRTEAARQLHRRREGDDGREAGRPSSPTGARGSAG